MQKNEDFQGEKQVDSPPESIWYWLYHKPRVLERETSFYILVSALDFYMTYILLSSNEYAYSAYEPLVIESNPFARYFLNHWGIRGMIYFKFALVAFVAVIAQYIAQTHYRVARNLLLVATAIVSCVVVYSYLLYLKGQVIISEFPDVDLVINLIP